MKTILNLITGAALALVFLVPAVTHFAPMGGFVGTEAEIEARSDGIPLNTPTYSEFARKGCYDIKSRPGDYYRVLAVDINRNAHVMDYDKAKSIIDSHDFPVLWVVGSCR